jgi:hypothetical protein
MEGKVIGKVTDEEKEQLVDFKRRDDAIYKMIEKLVMQQHRLEADQDQWFEAIREKYGIKPEAAITIKHDTGEVYEVPQDKVVEGGGNT